MKKIPEEIKIEIKPAHDRTKEILWLFQPPDPRHEPVPQRHPLQIEQRGSHAGFAVGGSGGGELPTGGSLVARKNISSRLASPSCPENFCMIPAIGPSTIFRPFFKIKMCEQTSSSRCSRC